MESGVLRKNKKISLTKVVINMQFFFQSINCNPIESEVEIDKENTRKEKDDEKNVDFF